MLVCEANVQEDHAQLAQLELVSGSEDGQLCVWGFEKDLQLGRAGVRVRRAAR